MDLIVDANIIFAILIKESINQRLLFYKKFHFSAPEFLFQEIEKYKTLIKEKAK